jgi:hypothetical protein
MKNNSEPKIRDKTYVTCTENERRVKGLIVEKTEFTMVVDLPSGFQLTMVRRPKRKLYASVVGTLEFVSDGWEVS